MRCRWRIGVVTRTFARRWCRGVLFWCPLGFWWDFRGIWMVFWWDIPRYFVAIQPPTRWYAGLTRQPRRCYLCESHMEKSAAFCLRRYWELKERSSERIIRASPWFRSSERGIFRCVKKLRTTDLSWRSGAPSCLARRTPKALDFRTCRCRVAIMIDARAIFQDCFEMSGQRHVGKRTKGSHEICV